MKNSTLCYIEKNSNFLMLYRNRKQNDCNAGKWIGVGGKFESGESPDDCLIREVKEETGLDLISYKFRGIVTFVSDEWETEQMFLFTSDDFEGKLCSCNEGTLAWIPKSGIEGLPLWEGDRIFLNLIRDNAPIFFLRLEYRKEKLISARLDGKETIHGE